MIHLMIEQSINKVSSNLFYLLVKDYDIQI
jgi:hypothetical protein